MIKLLIFDLDGTLVDSAPDIIATANHLITSRGREALSDEVITAAIGHGIKNLVKNIFSDASNDEAFLERLSQDYFSHYKSHLLDRTRPMPHIEEFLSSWQGQIAILTNKAEEFALDIIHGLSLARFPWLRIIGGDTLSQMKPHPVGILECMKAAGTTKDETIMIGDGIPDIRAAHAAGVRSIALDFGYTQKKLLEAERPTVMISSFGSLPGVLESLS